MGINRTVRPAGAVQSGPGGGTTNGGGVMAGAGVRQAARGWTPTVANLFVLVVLEVIAFGIIRTVFKRLTD